MDLTRDKREWILRWVDLNLAAFAVLMWITFQGTLTTHPSKSGKLPSYDDPEAAFVWFLAALGVGLVAFLVGGSARFFVGPAHLWGSGATLPSPAKSERYNVLSGCRPSRHEVGSMLTVGNVAIALTSLGGAILLSVAAHLFIGFAFLLGSTMMAVAYLPVCTIQVERADGQVSQIFRAFGLVWQESIGKGPLQVVTIQLIKGKGGGYFLKVVTAQGAVVPLVPNCDALATLDKAREIANSWAEALQIPLRTPSRGYIESIEELATLRVD